jgi:hypothetical protein
MWAEKAPVGLHTSAIRNWTTLTLTPTSALQCTVHFVEEEEKNNRTQIYNMKIPKSEWIS